MRARYSMAEDRMWLHAWLVDPTISMVYQITGIQTFEGTDRHIKGGDSHNGTTGERRASLGTLIRRRRFHY